MGLLNGVPASSASWLCRWCPPGGFRACGWMAAISGVSVVCLSLLAGDRTSYQTSDGGADGFEGLPHDHAKHAYLLRLRRRGRVLAYRAAGCFGGGRPL